MRGFKPPFCQQWYKQKHVWGLPRSHY